MSNSSPVCSSCGARLTSGDQACPLCGQPVLSGEDAATSDGQHDLPAAADVFEELPAPTVVEADGDATIDVEPAKKSGIGAIVLMAGLLLVVGLYLISSISGSKPAELQTDPTAIAELDQAPENVEPLDAAIVDEVARVKSEADGLQGTARLDKLRELAVLYQNHERFDLAGDTQVEIANESGMEIDWVRAGNLYYDWMESRQGSVKTTYARKAISAYQSALEINPNNLDVRTDMAVAYLFDPQNPMQAIINTNQVLQVDSLHLQANFNRGIMLMQINRMDDALAQFRKVLRLAPDSSQPVHQRAAEAIKLIEARPGANVQ